MKLNTSNKAFTLIELMVVMAIIGVLAIYLVPQLVGAQARSRDAGRVASLKSLSAVLETYNSDEGTFPRAPHNATDVSVSGDGCFSTIDGTVNGDLWALLKWGKSPVDPQKGNAIPGCSTSGAFAYHSLTKDGISDGGYILIANVETYKKANMNLNGVTIANDGSPDYSTFVATVGGKLSAELANATESVYAEMN